ncbi:hypothetical protein ES703_00330 [subsurface metagenome]
MMAIVSLRMILLRLLLILKLMEFLLMKGGELS